MKPAWIAGNCRGAKIRKLEIVGSSHVPLAARLAIRAFNPSAVQPEGVWPAKIGKQRSGTNSRCSMLRWPAADTSSGVSDAATCPLNARPFAFASAAIAK